MAFYALGMLDIALELAEVDDLYEDMAITYVSYFAQIVDNINGPSGLWNEEDGFYYDVLTDPDKKSYEVKLISMIGLLCAFPALVLTQNRYKHLPDFCEHLESLLPTVTRGRHQSLSELESGEGKEETPLLLSLVSEAQLRQLLKWALDEKHLLSDFGVRALSKVYAGEQAYRLNVDNRGEFSVDYCPGESNSGMFGGNSNWRGPIWLCMNFLLLEALDTFHHFFGNSFTVEMPTGSEKPMNLSWVTLNLRKRLVSIFTAGAEKSRPAHGLYAKRYATDPHFKDLLLFYEYFNGDNGFGCGASHQTGWTALVACLIHQLHIQERDFEDST
jgi:hypothetical protein